MVKKILFLLAPQERRQGLAVLSMFIVMAVLESAGVVSLLPFLSVLSDPTLIETNKALGAAYSWFDFHSIDSFLTALGIAAFIIVVVSALFRALTHYVMNRYIEMRRHSIARRLLEGYLKQPYEFFLGRHSSDLSKSILSEVDQLTLNIFRPGAQLIAYSVVAIAIFALMLVLYPQLTLTVALVISAPYVLVFVSVRGVLARLGTKRWRANKIRFMAANDALRGIKNIKLRGQEGVYVARFSVPSREYARSMATSQTLGQIPKFAIEALSFGGVIVLVLFLISAGGGVTGDALREVLPVLGVLVYGASRLLPAIQRVYQAAARLRFGSVALDELCKDMRRCQVGQSSTEKVESLVPRASIALQDLEFTYPNASHPALRNIALTIPVGQSIGIIGETGAGKTTLVDVLLGLLTPNKGSVDIDGKSLSDELVRNWQQALGYVPQEIFLADTTLAENIAFGVPSEQIDNEQVVRCARIAQIHEFVMTELPEQYCTVLGEDGVRLSGGQRQRLGIARALYHDPAVIVFDEATSALDVVTETAVMEGVMQLAPQKTIIMITHRLSTVRKCDKLLVLDKGQIVEAGSISELEQRGGQFDALQSLSAVNDQ